MSGNRKYLITGATGNIGREVIPFLYALDPNAEIIAAARDVEEAKKQFPSYDHLIFRAFDFTNPASFQEALEEIDVLFLLRPPQIAKVGAYFHPLLEAAKKAGIQKIVFLSVQGVEKSALIPHHRIEKKIRSLGFDYIFVRPSYFMQNLTTTLLPDIKTSRMIMLPSGKAKFNWIDVKNIGEVTAHFLSSFEKYKNQAYEITGNEYLDFAAVAQILTEKIGTNIHYKSTNPLAYFFKKKSENFSITRAMIITMIHFGARFQKKPPTSSIYQEITDKAPTNLSTFIEREATHFHP